MPTRKSRGKPPTRASSKHSRRVGSETAVGTTVSGPSSAPASRTELADHAAEQEILAAATPFNSAKPSEYGARSTSTPVEGPHQPMPSPTTGAGTLSEKNESPKTGAAAHAPRSLDGSLESKRVNSEEVIACFRAFWMFLRALKGLHGCTRDLLMSICLHRGHVNR